nr:MAG TPA: major capsid protein [Caudoviricetes sp.]
MIINPQNLRGIYVAFNTLFTQAFEGQKPTYERVATVVPSTTDSETYAWLGDIPGMREWVGDREIQNLTGSDYTIKNKDFELTVGVGRNAIEDDKIGLYKPSIQMLGESAALHPDELVYGLLSDGFKAKCYDSKAFYATDHAVGKGAVSNKLTAKLTAESYKAARAMMMGYKNSKGRSLGLVPDLLVVPPALEAAARDILVADFVNGTKNTMQGTAEIHVEPRLKTDSEWHLLCTKRPIKPLIYQQRKKAKFVSKTAETDDNVFMSKTFVYGVDSRGNAGFGFWQMAVGSDGSEA